MLCGAQSAEVSEYGCCRRGSSKHRTPAGIGIEREIERLSLQLADLRNLDVLEAVLVRCRGEDMRNGDVYLALEELSKRAAVAWPIDQFRKALDIENEEGRWQNVHASLNAIRRAVGL